MRTYRTRHLVVPMMLAGLLIMLGTVEAQPPQKPVNFRANLSGAEEVPPVDTKARGQALFQLSKDGTELSYKLIVANLEDPRVAHIHLAPVGVNGPAVVFLFDDPVEGVFSGVLAEGVITADDLFGTLAGAELADLIDHIEAGNAYVNVHTLEHPPGEIRGQIR